MRNQLVFRYFIMTLLCLVGFIATGFLLHNYLLKSVMNPGDFQIKQNPPLFFAKLIKKLAPEDPLKGFQSLNADLDSDFPFQLCLADQNYQIIAPENCEFDFDRNKVSTLTTPYSFIEIKGSQPNLPPMMFPRQMPPPPQMPPASSDEEEPRNSPPSQPPPPNMPPQFLRSSFVISLDYAKKSYLIIKPTFDRPSIQINSTRPKPPSPWFGIIFLIVSMTLGIGVALSLIYISVNKKVSEADEVLNELQKGNLKARFKIERNDEFGRAMLRFNRMADEIEKLVQNLKNTEQARNKLLQELAHDLRTPIASLKNLQETLYYKSDKMTDELRQEFLELSLSEIKYFEHLVEDLLFLSQVSDPKYSQNSLDLDLQAILNEEVQNLQTRQTLQSTPIEFDLKWKSEAPFPFKGDHRLIQRLFRNALENATSFARSKVVVEVAKVSPKDPMTEAGKGSEDLIQNSLWQIRITDDGPGFNSESLSQFGERRFSRKIESDKSKRISVGLGSVVMKTICSVYGGSLKASNMIDSQGKVLGAQIEILI